MAKRIMTAEQMQDRDAWLALRNEGIGGSDASVIVVSEETGNISFVQEGRIRTMGSITELRLAIEESYK